MLPRRIPADRFDVREKSRLAVFFRGAFSFTFSGKPGASAMGCNRTSQLVGVDFGWAAMEALKDPDRRRVPRRRVFKGAQISFRGLRAAIDCTVRDISEKGARLVVESPIGVPDRFDLVQNGVAPRFCRVVWRKATQIAVEFIDSRQ